MVPAVSFSVRISPVKMSGGISLSHFSFSASSILATRSPVSPPFSSNYCPVTIIFMLPIVFLRSSTSPTNLATSLHPLQVNTHPAISVHECVHHEVSNCNQQLHSFRRTNACKCLLAIVLLLVEAISRSIESIDVAFKNTDFPLGKFTNIL